MHLKNYLIFKKIAPHTKGIFIGGASGTGKKMIVHAIANEINATLLRGFKTIYHFMLIFTDYRI